MGYSETTKKLLESDPTARIAWSVAYALVGTMIVVINILTLCTFIKTTSLGTRKHVMIINLAVADLLFGVTGMPSTIFYIFKPTIISYYVFQILNTFFKMASLLTLGAIAVERMHAIIWPIRHQVMKNSVYKIALMVIWIASAAATTAAMFNLSGSMEIPTFVSLLLPIAISGVIITTVACYVCIWISVRRRKRRKLAVSVKREKALAVTLLLVAGAFIVTWAIPMFYLSISRMCKNCNRPSGIIIKCGLLLFAVQSLINPVIYCFRLPTFKASMKARVHEMKCSDGIEPRRRLRTRQATVETEMTSASGIIEVNE